MIRKFKKQISLLFAGSFSMVLAACYGMPVDMQNEITVKTVNEFNEAIPDLKLTMTNNGERIYENYTDETGTVYYPYLEDSSDNDYKVSIEDVDGEENGGNFLSESIDITNSQSYYKVDMKKQ